MYIQKVVTFHQKNASKRSIMLTFSVLIIDGTRPQTGLNERIVWGFGKKISVLWLYPANNENYTPSIWQFELEKLWSVVNSVFVISNSSIFEVKIRAASSSHAIESLSC